MNLGRKDGFPKRKVAIKIKFVLNSDGNDKTFFPESTSSRDQWDGNWIKWMLQFGSKNHNEKKIVTIWFHSVLSLSLDIIDCYSLSFF
jgi:hypothetical protein